MWVGAQICSFAHAFLGSGGICLGLWVWGLVFGGVGWASGFLNWLVMGGCVLLLVTCGLLSVGLDCVSLLCSGGLWFWVVGCFFWLLMLCFVVVAG